LAGNEVSKRIVRDARPIAMSHFHLKLRTLPARLAQAASSLNSRPDKVEEVLACR
jgi:hypothetical protein